MSETRFKVGDPVWRVSAGTTDQRRPCRVCAGKKKVTLILGSEERVELSCDMCGKGCEEPTGIEIEYAYEAKATLHTIGEVTTKQTAAGEVTEYKVFAPTGGYWSLDLTTAFTSEAEAMTTAAALVADHEAEVEQQMARKEKSTNKSYAWNAGYHLREAKRHREQLAYHERKAVLLKAKAKTE